MQHWGLPADANTIKRSCMVETMAGNSSSGMDQLSVGIAFRGVFVGDIFVPAVNMSFMPAVSPAWVITIFFIWIRALLLIEVSFVAAVVVPPTEMFPLSRVSIGPFMIPA